MLRGKRISFWAVEINLWLFIAKILVICISFLIHANNQLNNIRTNRIFQKNNFQTQSNLIILSTLLWSYKKVSSAFCQLGAIKKCHHHFVNFEAIKSVNIILSTLKLKKSVSPKKKCHHGWVCGTNSISLYSKKNFSDTKQLKKL